MMILMIASEASAGAATIGLAITAIAGTILAVRYQPKSAAKAQATELKNTLASYEAELDEIKKSSLWRIKYTHRR